MRRQAILDAALVCFGTRGVAETTIAEIRAKCGASIGSIYHHFEDKEALARALYIEGIRAHQEEFLKQLERHPSAESGVKAAVAYHFEWIRRHPDWARYLFGMREAHFMSPAAEEAIRKMNRGFNSRVQRWLEPHYATDEIARMPTDVFFAILFGPIQMFGRWWLSGRMRRAPGGAIAALGEAAWTALRGRSDAARVVSAASEGLRATSKIRARERPLSSK